VRRQGEKGVDNPARAVAGHLVIEKHNRERSEIIIGNLAWLTARKPQGRITERTQKPRDARRDLIFGCHKQYADVRSHSSFTHQVGYGNIAMERGVFKTFTADAVISSPINNTDFFTIFPQLLAYIEV
jgi:hypothetical protein